MTELLVDGLELLGEIVFLLILLHLSLDAALDGLVYAGGNEFSAEIFIDLTQALPLIQHFQDGLLVQVVHLEAGSHGVGQRARIFDERKGRELLGRDAAVLTAGFRKGFLQGLHHGGQFFVLREGFFHAHGAQARESPVAEGGARVQRQPRSAVQPFAHELDGVVLKPVGAQHAADHAHLKQVFRAGPLDGGTGLRDQKYLFVVFGDGAVDGAYRRRTPDMERHDGVREHHHFTQSDDGQFQRSLFSHRNLDIPVTELRSCPEVRTGTQDLGPGAIPGKVFLFRDASAARPARFG